ncbi:hypothetical protein [Candidatus Tokpelaia sp.]|uniref:hypothetical protein n=1 Tax=Candidatus Tokpelaia sp. TaxID=2233777 RepID=UPI0016801F46|nr:hypothetical protein [Candidatus Tokpelaia sp.]
MADDKSEVQLSQSHEEGSFASLSDEQREKVLEANKNAGEEALANFWASYSTVNSKAG